MWVCGAGEGGVRGWGREWMCVCGGWEEGEEEERKEKQEEVGKGCREEGHAVFFFYFGGVVQDVICMVG